MLYWSVRQPPLAEVAGCEAGYRSHTHHLSLLSYHPFQFLGRSPCPFPLSVPVASQWRHSSGRGDACQLRDQAADARGHAP
jgi:hypothetical protein